MKFAIISFACENCETELVAKVEFVPGFSAGLHRAQCPKCEMWQGEFPGEVLEVFETPSQQTA